MNSLFERSAVYPNPFNTRTTLSFFLTAPADIVWSVHDSRGREITKQDLGRYLPGSHSVIWEASGLASGIYFACLKAGDSYQMYKMILTK